jgi:hypothetical protein
MLNDKGRRGIRHLKPPEKWASQETRVIRLPASRTAGGWGSGWFDWYPWEIESFDLRGETATVRNLKDRRQVRFIRTDELERLEEVMPFGTVKRSSSPPFFRRAWWATTIERNPRYV